jgi:hypothetical protein
MSSEIGDCPEFTVRRRRGHGRRPQGEGVPHQGDQDARPLPRRQTYGEDGVMEHKLAWRKAISNALAFSAFACLIYSFNPMQADFLWLSSLSFARAIQFIVFVVLPWFGLVITLWLSRQSIILSTICFCLMVAITVHTYIWDHAPHGGRISPGVGYQIAFFWYSIVLLAALTIRALSKSE